ncbi:MAG: right-handed parallel beta-helix repeat-containing protein [Planctomycetaceae bacterium]|nr:right-handed parallel beta-helix repeat-containing protein [Planctomycetales bacterium]MCB9925268.1 right-handed parallel beta-helix repeat-containing protein [Planctomycetaceae bacterium]
MQRRTHISISVITLAASCLTFVTGTILAQDTGSVLPGARPMIDAAKFPSLQAALDAVPEGGGLVQLPAGTFEITEPLRVHTEDTCIQGAGTATHIKNLNTEGQPALLVSHLECEDAKTDRKHQLWRIRLTNFRVTGNEQSGAGIEARQINEILVDSVTVSENGGDGIFLNYCYEDPRIATCLITYNKQVGVKLHGCHDIVVASSQFEENQDALHCFDGFNLCMTGCCVDDHLGDGVVIENTYGSVLSGNMIEECNATAVILDRDCYGITVSSNVIAHNGGGIDLRDAHGCAVSANTFTIIKTNALRIGPDSGRITVGGNNFSNSYIGDSKVRRGTEDLAAAGLVLEATKDISISGNTFSGLTTKALSLVGESSGIVFANNVLSDVESDHENLKSSVVSDNLDSNASRQSSE